MKQPRSSGVLVHPTSFPGPLGIGDLGAQAYRFVDWLVSAGQSLWQVLPLGPTGYGDSPYASFSSHAGNPMLIDLRRLVELGDLDADQLASAPAFPTDHVDYGWVIPWKMDLLRQAAARFQQRASGDRWTAFEVFCHAKAHWLDDYALFMALKGAHDGAMWNTWALEIVQRKPEALARSRARLADPIMLHKYVQYQFFEQWSALRRYANQRGVRIIGDIPIFVAPDSADAWAAPEVFFLDQQGQMTVIAGVPPDYFSPTGQRWGNPLYRWDVLARDGYRWWILRVQSVLELVDVLRIDHFRGFQDYWEIPSTEPTAVNGRWLPGPGDAFFDALKGALGQELPIIAEDLGMITDEVHALRDRAGLPGMKVLHFAFDGDPSHEYLPHNYRPDCVVYLGTHDNDTTLGWFEGLGEGARAYLLRYLDLEGGQDLVHALMRAAFVSVADVAVVTAQDLLRRGRGARMNTPGTSGGNWQWRFEAGAFDQIRAGELASLTETYGRRVTGESASL